MSKQTKAIAEAIVAKIKPFKTKSHETRAASIIEQELDKLQLDAPQFITQLEDYAFLLPKEKRDEALKAYEETGEVRLTIHRTLHKTSVTLQKIGDAMPTENVEIAETVATPSGVVNIAAVHNSVAQLESEVEHQIGPQTHEDAPVARPDPTPTPTPRNRKVAILLATSRDYNPRVMLSILGQWKATLPDPSRIELVSDTLIHNARNELAKRFLAGEEEWSYWQDSDIIAPIGNPVWFQRWVTRKFEASLLAITAIGQLLDSAEKAGLTMLSGIYSQRNSLGRLVAPKTFVEGSGEEIKRLGPIRGQTRPASWMPFGCCIVHRSVFESIKEKHPELAPNKDGEPWNFFGAEIGLGGEDAAFCKRASDAGHTANFDLGLWCAHVGNQAFTL